MDDIEARVCKVITESLGVDAARVVPGATFIGDLGADSLDCMELIMAFEEEFNVEITDEEAEAVLLVIDAMALMKAKTSMESAA